jgi:hypothetical protein
MDGSRHEDSDPRYLNHFYDPVNNRGLVYGFINGYKSKEWAQSEEKQNSTQYWTAAKFASIGKTILSSAQLEAIKPIQRDSDFTWQRAIDLYAKGEKEQALFALGHVLHLLQDSTVPEHVRNDQHAPYDDGGSPYENWTSANYTYQLPDKNLVLRLNGKKSLGFSDIDSYFINLATYTNNNFFSRDTIKDYQLPQADYFEKKDGYYFGFKESNVGDYILFKGGAFEWNKGSIITLDSPFVLESYWNNLSVKAVQYGAGLVELFFKEAEEAKEKYTREKAGRPVLGLLSSGWDTLFGGGNSSDPYDMSQYKPTPVPEGTIVVIPTATIVPRLLPSATVNITPTPFPSRTSTPQPTVVPTSSPLIAPTSTPSLLISTGTPLPAGGQAPLQTSTPSSAITTTPTPEITGTPTPLSSPESSVGPGIPTATPLITESPTPTATPEATPTPTILPTSRPKILISEVQISGADAGDEFIELYNPNEEAVNLSAWSIQYLSGSALNDFTKIYKKNFEEGDTILGHGFFLIARGKDTGGLDGYRGQISADLTHRTFSMSGATSGGKIYLVSDYDKVLGNDDESIIDAINYAAILPPAGNSIERKALSDGMCVSPENENELLGNGCDSDNEVSDFIIRTSSLAQNSSSSVEPGASSLSALSVVQDNFYRSYVTDIGFYREPSSGKYYLDLKWPVYPFISVKLPHLASGQPPVHNWFVLNFYYDKTPPITPDIFWSDARPNATYNAWGLISPGGLKVKYPNCFGTGNYTSGAGIIFPETTADCNSIAGNHSSYAFDIKTLEDNDLLVEVLSSQFSSISQPSAGEHYVSVAYYAFQAGYEPNHYGIKQIGIDPNKYYFKSEYPDRQSPTTPTGVAFEYNEELSVLKINWNKSNDPDSSDGIINYKVDYGALPLLTSHNSIELQVEKGTTYNFEISAADNYGNLSEPAIAEFIVPAEIVLESNPISTPIPTVEPSSSPEIL